jgi:hypothetical protein
MNALVSRDKMYISLLWQALALREKYMSLSLQSFPPEVRRFLQTGTVLRFFSHLLLGCPRKEKKVFGSNRNKPKQDLFRVFSVCFVKPKNIFSVYFRVFFEPISKQPKQTKLLQNKRTQSGSFWKIPKYAFYKNLTGLSLAYCSWTNKFLLKRILKQE